MKNYLLSRSIPLAAFLVGTILALTLAWNGETGLAQETEPDLSPDMQALLADQQPVSPRPSLSFTPCISGMAGIYPCDNIDLLAFLPLSEIGGGGGNDIWGWTDPITDREYAIMGRTNGTSFVDISDPFNPVYLGNLPSYTGSSSWRDIKTYANHAYIVSDNNGSHGMQVFDLTQLRDVVNPPVTFFETTHYSQFPDAHNIIINEDTGYAYAVGINGGTSTCSGGLHMIDINPPTDPSFVGCFSGDGYTHDAQCVIYNGPDVAHQGSEICFNSNTDTLTIVDVTNKSVPVQLSRTGYTGSAYTHQGWLTEDHTYFLLGDELDESSYGHPTRTYIWDVSDLDAPDLIGNYTASTAAIDHNMYIKGDLLYQSNYRAGLRILDLSQVSSATLTEIGYFDIYPLNDNPNFNGNWSNYPYFDSGVIIASGMGEGLFVLKISEGLTVGPDSTINTLPARTVTHHFSLFNRTGQDDAFTLSVSGHSWPTTVVTTSPITITNNTTATISVDVDVPSVGNGTDTFLLTATSVTSPTIVAMTTGTTNASVNPGVIMSPNSQAASGDMGTTAVYTFTLINTGNFTDTFALTLNGHLWPTTAPTTTNALGSGESTLLEVMVDIPLMPDQTSDTFTLMATSSHNSIFTAQGSGTTSLNIIPGLITSGDMNGTGTAGQTVTYTLSVTNTGSYTDTFALNLGQSTWETTAAMTTTPPLAVGASDAIDIYVTIGSGISDSVTITVTSSWDDTVSQQVNVHTTVSETMYTIYLPTVFHRP